MRFIHCSDLHLDSKLSSNFTKDISQERRGEILHNFERMVDYAAQNHISAILITGDMFDSYDLTSNTKETFLSTIKNNPQINFYYLNGNHAADNFFSKLMTLPDNLKMFSSRWRTYEEVEGKINISGFKISANNADYAYFSLGLDPKKFNIVMLNDCELDTSSNKKTQLIDLSKLINKNIDYLALRSGTNDKNFDECGFVLIEVNETSKKFTSKFVPFAKKKSYQLDIDIAAHALDKSLKGEFVHQVESDNTLSKEDKAMIIRYGFLALAGEELI